MKRSEAIDIIYGILAENDVVLISKDIPEKILEALEKVGMAPPPTFYTIEKTYNGLLLEVETVKRSELKWEPETRTLTEKDFAGW